MGNPTFATGLLLLLCAVAGCSEQREQAENAVSAAKAMMGATEELQKAGEAADKAAREAEARALDEIPEGATEEQAQQIVQSAKAMAALGAMQAASGKGPITNWRQLEPFLPDSLGGLEAKAKLKGKTNKAGAVKLTEVRRSYADGERSSSITITDAFWAPMMQAPFKMAAMMEEDSSEGYRRGARIDGQTAIVEWDESSRRSKATVLVGDRFVVAIEVRKAKTDGDARQLAEAMALSDLAAVKGEAEDAAK